MRLNRSGRNDLVITLHMNRLFEQRRACSFITSEDGWKRIVQDVQECNSLRKVVKISLNLFSGSVGLNKWSELDKPANYHMESVH